MFVLVTAGHETASLKTGMGVRVHTENTPSKADKIVWGCDIYISRCIHRSGSTNPLFCHFILRTDMNTDPAVIAARRKLASKFGKNTRTGGKGSVRRKKKSSKSTSADDKRLQSTLKRLGVNNIPAIEEVNLFKEDGKVIHFQNPKVQANIGANTYVVSGRNEEKSLQELLPGIINQLGPDSLTNLKKIAETFARGKENASAKENDSDDDVPELVEDFEEASEKAE